MVDLKPIRKIVIKKKKIKFSILLGMKVKIQEKKNVFEI